MITSPLKTLCKAIANARYCVGRRTGYPSAQFFANHAVAGVGEAQIFVNVSPIDEKGWVQLAPYGDFINVDNSGRRVIQRFEKKDAEQIVNEFNSGSNLPQQLLGLAWYKGHPDHPRFAGKPGHTDFMAYGRIKKLEAREDGLYANVKFGAAGKQLLEDEAFHGHSVNWLAIPSELENGIQVYRPVKLKSVGFTNDPAIPVRPASIANEADLEAASFDEPLTNYAVGAGDNKKKENEDMIIPPRLKLLAGFKAEDDVTMDQVIAALEKKQTKQPTTEISNMKTKLKIGDKEVEVTFANESDAGTVQEQITKLTGNSETANAAKTKAEQDLANEQTARKAERKARATLIVEPLVKVGKILKKDEEARIEELCNAADFDAKAKEFANLKPEVKTTAKTKELAGKHVVLNEENKTAQAKFEKLLADRAQQFPNESYQDRFAAVASSDEGAQLMTLMKRAGESE